MTMSLKQTLQKLMPALFVALFGIGMLGVAWVDSSSGSEGPELCGPMSVQALTAGQTIDIGSTIIANDEENLYVTLETTGNWTLGTTHVHVGLDIDDYPAAANGQPILGSFDYLTVRDVLLHDSAVSVDTYEIPLSDLEIGDECGLTAPLYVWTHAEAFLFDADGSVQEEQAFGGNTPDISENRWFFLAQYDVQCCEDGGDDQYRTQSQGGWGNECHGDNPGCYRDMEWPGAFPNGLTVGCNHTLSLSSSAAVADFLPSGGKRGALSRSYEDPTGKTEAGVLAGQLVAASLSLGFDNNVNPLAEQVLCNTNSSCEGLSAGALVQEANLVMGGCRGTLELNAAELSDCLRIINENYSDGDSDAGHLCAPNNP